MEYWKSVKGYETMYQISNYGNVKSLNFGRTGKEGLLKTTIDRHGYKYVEFAGRKKFKIHQLVAIAFIPNPENKPTVNHNDENKQNNHVDNLTWFTVNEQNKYSKGRKCVVNGIEYNSLREAAEATSIDRRKIKRMVA